VVLELLFFYLTIDLLDLGCIGTLGKAVETTKVSAYDLLHVFEGHLIGRVFFGTLAQRLNFLVDEFIFGISHGLVETHVFFDFLVEVLWEVLDA
jgi:hypothetical protein